MNSWGSWEDEILAAQKKWEVDSEHSGLIVSWKFCLNFCSLRLLKPTRSLVSSFIPYMSATLNTLFATVLIEIWMKRFPRFFWKNDFLSLFSWVRIKSHSPLFSPSSNFIKVLIQYICCFKQIRKYWKQRSIIGKQFDIRF